MLRLLGATHAVGERRKDVPFAERLAEKAETSARRASPRRSRSVPKERRMHPLDGFEASEIVELLRLFVFLDANLQVSIMSRFIEAWLYYRDLRRGKYEQRSFPIMEALLDVWYEWFA